jgi:ATP-binding cassette subfamily B protein
MKKLTLLKLLSEVFISHKKLVFGIVILQFATGAAPVISAWLTGILIDNIEKSLNLFNGQPLQHGTVFLIIVISTAILLTLNEIATVLHNFSSDALKDLTYQKIKFRLLKAVGAPPTNELFETPYNVSQINLAKKNADAISEYVSITSQVISMIFGLISSLALGLMIAWWIPMLLYITMGPLIYWRTRVENQSWAIKETFGETFTRLDSIERMLTLPDFSKDIRLYQMQFMLLEKWRGLYIVFINALNKKRLIGSLQISGLGILGGVGPLLSFYYVGAEALAGKVSLGSVSFLLGVIIQIRNSLVCLMYNSNDVIRTFLSAKPLLFLINLNTEKPSVPTYFHPKEGETPLLVVENVSFKYPEAKEYAIKNLSFSIDKSSCLAVVGANGSGKSTLLKLICRFYAATNGKIYYNGQDILSLPINEYRKKLNVLFQDYAKFPLTLEENIFCEAQNHNKEKLLEYLTEVGLEYLIDKRKYLLGKGLVKSIDLSGGEWQRLCIARMLAHLSKDSFLMLDEPTAALDPNAEHEIIKLLSKLALQHTSLIISHKLILSKKADNTLVLSKGELKEYGSHDTLIKNKGLYYELYKHQSQLYQ